MEKLELSFKPMLTPKEMLHKGIFGGTYFSRLVDHKDFPQDWFNKEVFDKCTCSKKSDKKEDKKPAAEKK